MMAKILQTFRVVRKSTATMSIFGIFFLTVLVHFTGKVKEDIERGYKLAEIDHLGTPAQIGIGQKKVQDSGSEKGSNGESQSIKKEQEAREEIFRGKDIVILTGFYPESNRSDMVIKSRQDYANLHGYTHHAIDLSKYRDMNHPCDKILAIREAKKEFKDSKWIWWLDQDAIIMNPAVDLGEHVLNPQVLIKKITFNENIRNVDPNFQVADVTKYLQHYTEIMHSKLGLVITQDLLGLDTNSFFIKNHSPYGDMILDLWEEGLKGNDRNYMRPEQDSLVSILIKHRRLKAATAIVPQETINAGIRDIGTVGPNSFYKKGDFVVQFSSCRYNNICMVVWNILAPSLFKEFGKEINTKEEVQVVIDI